MGANTNRGHAPATTSLDLVLGTREDPNEITRALATAAQHFHLISPATKVGRLPIGTSVALSAVAVDVATETYPLGEKGDKVGLGKDALFRIASALGVDWDPPARTDDGSIPNLWEYVAVGWIRGFDGARERIVGTKVLDVREGSATVAAILDRCRGTERKFAKLPRGAALPPELEAKAREKARVQVRDLRLFGDRHAATKAQLAAIRTRVRGSYAPADLARPFVVARLAWTGAGVDPDVAAEMTFEAMTGASRAIYGGRRTPRGDAPNRPPVVDATDYEVDEPPTPPAEPAPAPRRSAYAPPVDGSTVPAAAPATAHPTQPEKGPVCAHVGTFGGLPADATCRDGLADEPDWWCDVCRGDGAGSDPVARSGAVMPFGRSKGVAIEDAPDDDLAWMRDAVAKSVDDPSKARFRSKNAELLAALDAEIARRGG